MIVQHYDLGCSPPTSDFLHWLANVERHRRRCGESQVFINFVLGERSITERDFAFSAPRKAWRLHNMLVPSVRALASCTGYSIGQWGKQELGYKPQPPLNEILFAAPDDARGYMAHWLFTNSPVATITLRQSDFQTKRNSNIAEWQKVADWLASCNYCVVIVPDTEKALNNQAPGITGHRICEQAALNPILRLALYELANVNLMGSCGMYAMALYSGATMLQVNTIFPDIPLSTEESQRAMGIGCDSLLNPHQRIAWVPETFDAVKAELMRDDFLNAALKRERPIREIPALACLTMDKRIENIRNAVQNYPQFKRVAPAKEKHERPFILAAYGPSLQDSWPMLAKEEGDIFSVSGATDFLVKRGIIPCGHVESDPRAHKAAFTANPHPDVRYYMASCCDPSLFEQLRDAQVHLWHAYEGDEMHEVVKRIDPDSVLVLGGSNVGLRAIALGTTLGYRHFKLFGMDCSFRDDVQWAGEHSGKRHKVVEVRVANRVFKTSPAMLVSAKEFCQMLEHIPGCDFVIYGDGMLNYMMAENLRMQAEKKAA